MDSVEKVFWLLMTVSILALLVIVNYFGEITQVDIFEPEVPLLRVYKDEFRKVPVTNNVLYWTKVEEYGITYSQRVFIYNPKDYSQGIRVFWEMYPVELLEFSVFSSNLDNFEIGAFELREATFFLNMNETALITNFEVMTKIEGELLG